ncbi:hypothetical protein KO533_16575 [Shewanella sp. NKUCC05_KAH]|uniref:hypothetical protein n=1 Tax=Shewanella sp. NKUCC05_KAH TaxID=2842126 RepID=UPI001C5B9889|nr:hypothetical protein [Shewanella sp. NKUCC05_KAH]MBW3528165.1 hypothetical protein [Shewanella sp. NKUCC05_KAH]
MTAIVINFDKTWIASASPIVISFTDEPTPEIPEVPISQGTIGIMCGIGIAIAPSVAQQLTIKEATQSHATQLTSQWQVGHVTQIVTAKWQAKALLGITASVVWRWNNLVPCKADLLWLVPQLHGTQANSLWLSPESVPSRVEMLWRQPEATTQIITLALLKRALVATEVKLAHSNIRAAGDMKGIAWGPHAARWVCSSKYRPPKGKITINFSEPWVNAASPIVLNFTPSPNVCYWDDGGGLIGTNPSLPNIDFKIPIEPQIRRYYLMQPTITCVRVSDSLPIVITSVSISQSRGQWARSVSLEFSSRIDAQRAHNELLLITINGYEFYAIAEQPSVSKAFGIETHSSTGRSRAAELSSPYRLPISYTNTVLRSLGGIISDLLQNTGWTAELSGIPDFSVPAGAFSVGNKSPIDAINEAASQLGCMILADDTTRKLTIIPRWPTVPWEMATAVPDLTVHDAVITNYSESVSRNPLCDVVWLRGEQQGISAKVKRTGSAGNVPAADISAQLIVDNQAARIAGTNALADTGDKLNVTLSLPVMVDLPPATPGMLIGIREAAEVFKGTCDSWSIRASVSDRGDIDIEQSITVIRSIA